ncbi:hypothetical protein FOL47_011139 [Perkinsus chesapeaki]|uniref:Uncharacterized protein n=1 Tax=Perkinsus chesapeaki TaxID=330153 RepID=A0A7J6KYD8_PERCH|nr:hypothetical protein FOL47_011139 [Perkinsus chesapeaki]
MPKRGIRSHTSILTRRKRYSANKRARELLTSPPDGVQDYEISDVGHTLVDITSYIDFLTDLGKEHLASTNADPLRDGTGLNALLPSQHLTNALYSLPEVAKDVTNVFVKSVENNNLVDFVGRLKGSPTEKEVKVLEQRFGDAAQQCRSSLAKILHCSTRKSQCGASIRSDILRNLISALHDPDSSLSSEVDAGVSLGISQPLRKTGIFPPYTKKRDAEELQLLRLHQLANYTSASEDASIIEDIISKEIRLGRMKPLSLDEANDPSRVYAKMALIKKIGSASSKPKYRIVEDYRRNETYLYVRLTVVVYVCTRMARRTSMSPCHSE